MDDNYHTPPLLGEQQINGDLKWTVTKLVLHVMLCEHVKMNRLNHQYLFYYCQLFTVLNQNIGYVISLVIE